METSMIEIDIEVHKRIESERRSFSETPNMVLRRLLKLGQPEERADTGSIQDDKGAWTGKGVVLPASTQLRMEYRGMQHFGEIRNAAWVIDGKLYKSPSAAAGGAAVTKSGANPSLDGWKYWHVKRPGDHGWIPLSALRKKAGQ